MRITNAYVYDNGCFVKRDLCISGDIFAPNEDGDTIDMSGRYIIPGLIDCHLHLFSDPFTWDRVGMLNRPKEQMISAAYEKLDVMAKNGVTFFRDCGGYKEYEFELKPNERQPEFSLAGSALCITGGHCYWSNCECDGADGFVKGARLQIRSGADFVKVMLTGGFARKSMGVNHHAVGCPVQVSRSEMMAVTEECHRRGYKISAHCVGIEGIRLAVEVGIDSIEHGQFFDANDPEIPSLLAEMKRKDMAVVPTMAAYYKNYDKETVRDEYRYVDESLKRYLEAGVKVAMGTDAGCPQVGYNMAGDEIIHMVEAGMSPSDAIDSSTKNSAELLGIDSAYGSIRDGYFADFIILTDNPLNDIGNIKKIESVYKKGNLVSRKGER